MLREHPGYRARNLDVANIEGLTSGLCDIKERIRKRKDCPIWSLNFNDYIQNYRKLCSNLTD